MIDLKPGDLVKFMWPDGDAMDLVPKRVGVVMRTHFVTPDRGIARVYHDEDMWSVPFTWCTKLTEVADEGRKPG